MSEYGYMLPARVYTVDKGKEHYSMTVVGYNGIQKQGLERQAKCPPGAEPCQGQRGGALPTLGPGDSIHDIRGAPGYPPLPLFKRHATSSHHLSNRQVLKARHETPFTNLPAQSRKEVF